MTKEKTGSTKLEEDLLELFNNSLKGYVLKKEKKESFFNKFLNPVKALVTAETSEEVNYPKQKNTKK